MTSIRLAHKKKYTSISNNLSQNNNISLKSRGLMLYLLSLPDDWIVHVNHLVKTLKEGKRSILSALKELKEHGYIHLAKTGYKEGWEYFIFEEPTDEDEFKLFLRTTRFSNSSKTEQFHNEQLQSTKEEISIQKNNLTPKEKSDVSNSGKLKLRPEVTLTIKQHEQLKTEYDTEAVNWMLDKLNEYKVNKNQTYKSDYLPLRRWVEDAYKNHINMIEANDKIIAKNISVIKNLIQVLERQQKRGNLITEDGYAKDTVLNRNCKLTNVEMPQIVGKWYGLTWKAE